MNALDPFRRSPYISERRGKDVSLLKQIEIACVLARVRAACVHACVGVSVLIHFIYLIFIHVQQFSLIKINIYREKRILLIFAAPPKVSCLGPVDSEDTF